MEASFFRPGDNVEVQGSVGAWYPGKIVDIAVAPTLTLRKRNSFDLYKVEFKNLLAINDPTKPLVKYTPLSLLRPEPPADNVEEMRFEQNDLVDAFYLGMWWPGVVLESSCGGSDNKYKVGFENSPDFQECDRNELRPSWNWANGVWTRAP